MSSPRPASWAMRARRGSALPISRISGPLTRWYETVGGRKKARYAMVSAVSVPIGTLAVGIFNLSGLSPAWAALAGSSVGAIPSYVLSRYWVWGRRDPNRLLREILPFWSLTLVGLGLSFAVGHEAGQITRHLHIGGLARLTILLAANLAGFGILWVVKYLICDRLLFVDREETSATEATPAVPSREAQVS